MKKLLVALVILCVSPAFAQSVIDVDIRALVNEIHNNVARAEQLYENKTIRTTGLVQKVYSSRDVWIGVNAGEWDMDLAVYFKASEVSKIANLKRGQTITFRGVFRGGPFGKIIDAVIEANPAASQQSKPQNTNNAESYIISGESAYNRGDYDRAISDFTQAIRLDPNSATAYNNRGLTYDTKGDYDKALADYTQAIRLDPNSATTYANRSDVYNYKGEYDRAIADCNQVIRLDPKNASAYNNRGIAYYHKKDYDRAIADFTQAQRLEPNDATIRENLENARRRGK